MKLKVERKWKKEEYTIGRLYIDDEFICNTLEDKDRGLDDSMSEKEIKVYGKTAIPKGIYDITMTVVSPKFSKYEFYKEVCDGKVPRLLNVKGFDGILIHVADGYKGADLVLGCIGVGENKIKGGLINGKETFKKLYEKMLKAYKNAEKIIIEITD